MSNSEYRIKVKSLEEQVTELQGLVKQYMMTVDKLKVSKGG